MKKSTIFISVLSLIFVLFSGCSDTKNSSINSEPSSTTVTTTVTTTAPEPQKNPTVNVLAAGDNLIHDGIYNQAKARAKDGGYDFDYAYQYVAPMVKAADLAILNQETPIANDKFAPSSYPQFNSPTQLGDEMIKIGFDVFSHSNNHILDKGEAGLIATVDYWKSRNMLVYGAYRNQQELEDIPTKTVNGITFSFLGFMQHTNGLKLPANATARVVYTSDTATMERLIKKARAKSDVVVVSVHWGVEITNTVTQEQKDLAKKFVSWGTDVIIGTQPHAVQSMEYLDNPQGGKSLVTYSLGNFISTQDYNISLIGLVADFNVTKDLKTNKITISDTKAIPVITHYGNNFSNVTIYPYNQYTEALAKSHGANQKSTFSMAFINKILKDNVPEQFLYLK